MEDIGCKIGASGGLWVPKLRPVGSVGKEFGGQGDPHGTLGEHLGTLVDPSSAL